VRTASFDAKSGEIEEAVLALADCLAALGDSQRATALRAQAARIRAAHVELAPPLIS
jgi:hypothetical protein